MKWEGVVVFALWVGASASARGGAKYAGWSVEYRKFLCLLVIAWLCCGACQVAWFVSMC